MPGQTFPTLNTHTHSLTHTHTHTHTISSLPENCTGQMFIEGDSAGQSSEEQAYAFRQKLWCPHPAGLHMKLSLMGPIWY